MSLAKFINRGLAFAIILCGAGYAASAQTAPVGQPASKAPAKVTLSNLHQTYDGAPKSAEARTDPKGLTVTFTYDGSASAPTKAGSYTVAGTVQDANYEGSAAAKLTVARAGQKIAFNALVARTFGDAPFDLASTVSSGLTAAYESSNTAVATVSGNKVTITGAGTTRIMAYQGGDENHLPAKPVRQMLTIAKAPQKIAFNALMTRTFGDADFSPGAAASSSLPVLYTSSNPKVATVVENRVHIVGAGTSTITAAQPGDNNYRAAGPVKQLLAVNKARAKVILAGLEQTYDGAPKAAVAGTEPEGLTVTFTYGGNTAAPTRAGSYTVVGTVKDANYEGSAESSMTIAKAPQTIAFNAPVTATFGNADFSPAPASSGLPVLYTSSDPKVATVVENRVHIVGAGTSTITAAQPGDNNYLPAEAATQTLTVNKAKAKVNLSNLHQTYDGAPKQAEARTDPKGLTVTFTYDGSASAPTKAGSYTVVGTVQDANYEGSAAAKLTVARAGQKIAFNALVARTFGDAPFDLASTVSSGLTATYESSNTAVATVSGNKVTITGAGTTRIMAYQGGDENHLPAKPVRQMLTIAKAPQKIAFNALMTRTFGDADFSPGAAASSSLPVLYTSSNPKVATVVENRVHIVGAGTSTITAAQPGDNNYRAAGPVKQLLAVNKARAKVILAGLEQTYDGAPKAAVAGTEPEGLTVTFTYGGNTAAPTRAGSYTVVGTVKDANYEGSAESSMTIAKAPQTIAFNAPVTATFGNADFSPGAAASSGLPVLYTSLDPKVATVVENRVHIVGAGASTITAAQPGDDNYQAAETVQQLLTVNKARAKVILTGLEQVYDGAPKAAVARTEPEGLSVALTYDNKAAEPAKPGSYAVAAMVQDANYEGSAESSMTIGKAPQTITFTALPARTYGEGPFALAATVSSGLTATYGSSNPAVVTISGSEAMIAGAGTTAITAYQAGDNNYLAAEPMKLTLTVNKAKAKITLTGLDHTYDGAAKPAGARTDPEGLNVTFTYDNNAEAPVNAGDYTVAATVQDANYEGSAGGSMTIGKAPQTITFTALPARTYGEGPFALAATVSSGLTATYGSSNPAVATISGSEAMIAGAGTTEITAYQAGDENHLPAKPVRQILTIAKSPQKIAFNAPVTATYGDADFSPGAAASSGLQVLYTSSDPKVATVVENQVHIVGIGSSTITASHPGDSNYLAAEPMKQTLTVNKAKAKITLMGLDQTYDGAPKAAVARTEPEGLSVALTYDNKTAEPVKPGSYTVSATVQDANFEGSAGGSMIIAKAPQLITFDTLAVRTYGEGPFALASTVSSGLTATYGSSNPAVATISGSEAVIAGVGTTTITAYQMGDGIYQQAEPVQQALVVRDVPHHIVVLPLVNMSGQPAPVKEMRQELIARIVAEGAEVLDDETQERFMVRHRVRNVDGIDSVTAQALRQETGMDSVIITTLERYVDQNPPAIAMTSRLVSAEETPIILWMETVSLAGGDSPGVLGLGLIRDIYKLQKKAFDRLAGSFEKYLAREADRGSGRGERRFQPKTAYSSSFMQPGRKYSVAVAPFLNKSRQNNADSFLALHFMSQMTKEGTFSVIDPGSVREKLLFLRFIMQEGLSMRQADLIHDTLQADLILAGKVIEYLEVEGAPRVEFSALVFERKKKKVVWASWSFSRGNDDVSFFDWGRVNTADELASKMTQAAVWDLSTLGTLPDGQLPEKQPFRKGPWSLDRLQ